MADVGLRANLRLRMSNLAARKRSPLQSAAWISARSAWAKNTPLLGRSSLPTTSFDAGTRFGVQVLLS